MSIGCGSSTLEPMDKVSALRLLPALHAAAIVLEDAGCDDEAIGQRLGLDARAVRPLLQVARAKLAALRELPDDAPAPGQNR